MRISDWSSDVCSDHKRESEAAKEETEKRIQKTTEALVEQFETISRSVHTLNQQIAQNRVTVETIQRALSSPDGAGQAAETVLANTSKSFRSEEHPTELQSLIRTSYAVLC